MDLSNIKKMGYVGMNTSKLADISEIVSSIAIVVTLVFLTVQMQQNTRAIEASARQGAANADAQQLIQVINHPEMAADISEMSDATVVKVHFNSILFMRNRENEWAQHKSGVMDDATWVRLRASTAYVLQDERMRNWWINGGNILFDPEFIAEVNAELQKTPVTNLGTKEALRALILSPAEYQEFLEANKPGG
ncbi:MAG: hypothetical protein HOM55_08820 [Proteobacteria bacterium]|jgi:hypothetical protein|nr:hypothetical protein [Pseudomonadota bacterium]